MPDSRIPYDAPVMIRYVQNTDGSVRLIVELDAQDSERLMHVANMQHACPAVVAASIIHDVLQDDAVAHGEAHPDGVTIN